jgi:hypothetical protein
MEVWKDVEGYEGLYQVSNKGRVKSLERVVKRNGIHNEKRKERILSQTTNPGGYCICIFSKNNIKKYFSVSRLVAKEFIDNDMNFPVVNHLDGIKTNNRADNLEWTTYSGNVLHAIRTGLIVIKKGSDSFMYGTHLSEETKQKISDAGLGRKHKQESINKMKEKTINRHRDSRGMFINEL